jgi:molecular chaperone HscC
MALLQIHDPEAPARAVGIDLGTTNSLVAVMGADGPHTIPLPSGGSLLPSAVARDAIGRTLVGRAARDRMQLAPESGVARFKTAMGTPQRFALPGAMLSAPELSSLVLTELKTVAEAALGQKIQNVVITVPAYFRETQRAATVEAGRLAGLNVVRVVNEPTAAAIAYGLHAGREERRLMVVDLGGGTFDVSVLESFDGVLEVRASSGNTHLGGEDFTDNLLAGVLEQLHVTRLQERAPATYAGLRERCELLKCALSNADVSVLELSALRELEPGVPARLEVTRASFEAWNVAFIERMRACMLDAARQASLTPHDLDEILLVGGASRMPCIARLVEEACGKSPQCRLDPDEVVALGAAVQGALISGHSAVSDYVVTDITPFSLGIRALREGSDSDRYFVPVIHRGETIPVSRERPFYTVHPQQKVVRIEVFQGDRRFVDENEFLGQVEVACPPSAGAPEQNRRIAVRFTQDQSGLLEVEATVSETGQKASVTFERGRAALSPEQREAALQALQRLKVKARDLLPNRYLLERANELFPSLSRHQQQQLEPVLFAFEAALDAEDAASVSHTRAHLKQVLDGL